MKLRVLLSVVLAMSLLAAGACNTFKGLGKDVEKGGKTIQNVAEKARPSNN